MPTPTERLEKIIAAKVPSKVIFKATTKSNGSVFLGVVKIEDAISNVITEDVELQAALAPVMEEHFDRDEGKYHIQTSVSLLWGLIKRTIVNEYREVSKRCAATKRKTEQFIFDIKVDDKHLSNYLIQVFLRYNSKTYNSSSWSDRQDLFEQFEALRRTYGKRSR